MDTKSSKYRRFQETYEEIGDACEQMQARITSIDAMVSVGVNLHVELFALLNQGFTVFSRVPEVDVVVGHAMNQ